jgi:spore germination cell wall hydrolase CwlJ-like protein
MNLPSIALPALRIPLLGKRQVLSSFVLVVFVALYVVAGLSIALLEPARSVASARIPAGTPVVPGLGVPPEPEPMRFRDIAPEDAKAINAAVPIAALPNPAAKPFRVTFASDMDRLRAVECLTAAVYYEAAIEPLDGQRAVAQVILNRSRHPAYPKSICGVVFQGWERSTGCQFTFTCDGSIRRTPSASLWAKARGVALEALAGKVYAPVGWATHYHTNWVVPYWSSSLVKIALVGTHIFYRWEGGWGRPPAFRYGPGGQEPQFGLMKHLTSNPASLADAQTVDAAALAAAEAAAAAAAAAAQQAGVVPGVPEGVKTDMAKRQVIRRYEPMTKEAATAAALARSNEPASATHHWALSGLPAKPDAKAVEGEAKQPRCLEGVRKLPSKTDGAAPVTQAC